MNTLQAYTDLVAYCKNLVEAMENNDYDGTASSSLPSSWPIVSFLVAFLFIKYTFEKKSRQNKKW
jgi:hypothetical protein